MRTHTVILGAGATVATIPEGDKNGRKSSVMNGLIDKLNLNEVLKDIELKTKSDNLEDIYFELYSRPDCKSVVEELESRIYDYFSILEIPNFPTIYDFLILSLTETDAIATFNWDPLLLQAYLRCMDITDNLPKIFCLHGNVAMNYCYEHNEYGYKGAICPVCKRKLVPTKLLYPIGKKNYIDDNYINNSWEAIKYMVENSYMLTIFGYSAPSSDIEAVELLKSAWGGSENRQLEEVSVIDIIDEEDILKKWGTFIHSHHYRYSNSFFESYLGNFPRRSCETVFSTFQLNLPPNDKMGFKEGMTWEELDEFLYELLKEENETPKGKHYPLHYQINR
ncbi:MAG: hypothetical protein VB048_09005 [Bacteroidaceae bacterium]|nr:hypothetical protein [Bacteroidaceae bacterium]MEA5018359.1 hypothetical protein [Erysipelotrichaceae bacterium]